MDATHFWSRYSLLKRKFVGETQRFVTSDGPRQQLAALGREQLELHLQVGQRAARAEVLLADGRRVNAAEQRLQTFLQPPDP